mgnify:CR=1 FL=1|tara:strand:- start:11 stop:358 length:348 start_codon:yes stop_codon:yes gene_type:complete
MRKTKKTYSKALIEKLIREELAEATWADFLGKEERTKRRDAAARKALRLKRVDREQRVRKIFSDIGSQLAAVPQDLEGKVRVLYALKETLSRALIWGEDPLMDLISEDGTDGEKK